MKMSDWQSPCGSVRVLCGDAALRLRDLPDECVQACVTSPPYFGLRDYGVAGQIGLESTPDEFVGRLVALFREVRRVLRDDGTLWVNLGDSYCSTPAGNAPGDFSASTLTNPARQDLLHHGKRTGMARSRPRARGNGIKPKDLLGMPWRVAFALQADGWYLRQDIIWSKPNPMPESVRDRCTKAHEYIFLLSKSPRYYFDAEAIAEPAAYAGQPRGGSTNRYEQNAAGMDNREYATRNKRSVWTVGTEPYPEAHFATFPQSLIEPCILAGCPENCCGVCGSPWVRQVETIDTGKRQKMADGWDTGEGGHGTFHRNGREKGEADVPVMARVTTGFAPSCACNATPIPGTALDPFGGSGTTAVVAVLNRRNAIMCELNPEYIELMKSRLARPLCLPVSRNGLTQRTLLDQPATQETR